MEPTDQRIQPIQEAQQADDVVNFQSLPPDREERNKKSLKILTYILISIVLIASGAFGSWYYLTRISLRKDMTRYIPTPGPKRVEDSPTIEQGAKTETIYLVDTCPGDKCISEGVYFKYQDGPEHIDRPYSKFADRIDDKLNFSDFENTAEVKLETKALRILSFMDDLNNEDMFYITVLVQGEEDINEHKTQLLKIKRDGSIVTKLWESPERVSLESGVEIVWPGIRTWLSNKHLLIGWPKGITEPTNEPESLFIINTETGAVKMLGQVSVSHVWREDKFKYKRFTTAKEPCIYDEGPGPCDAEGEQVVYRPTGGFIYDTLP